MFIYLVSTEKSLFFFLSLSTETSMESISSLSIKLIMIFISMHHYSGPVKLQPKTNAFFREFGVSIIFQDVSYNFCNKQLIAQDYVQLKYV